MSFSGALRPPTHLPPQFASLSSLGTSQTEYEPVDLVCSEDSSSLGAYRSFHRVPRDTDIDITNDENATNFCLGNSGEFLHRVFLAAVALFACRFLTSSRSALLIAIVPFHRLLAIMFPVARSNGAWATTNWSFPAIWDVFLSFPRLKMAGILSQNSWRLWMHR
jgi:hypothetical protein